jgi:hypothetical protein
LYFCIFVFLFCLVLFCFVLFCFVLFCFVLFCFVLGDVDSEQAAYFMVVVVVGQYVFLNIFLAIVVRGLYSINELKHKRKLHREKWNWQDPHQIKKKSRGSGRVHHTYLPTPARPRVYTHARSHRCKSERTHTGC